MALSCRQMIRFLNWKTVTGSAGVFAQAYAGILMILIQGLFVLKKDERKAIISRLKRGCAEKTETEG